MSVSFGNQIMLAEPDLQFLEQYKPFETLNLSRHVTLPKLAFYGPLQDLPLAMPFPFESRMYAAMLSESVFLASSPDMHSLDE